MLLVLTPAGVTVAEQSQTNLPLRLALDLVDGSHIIGIPDIKSIPVQTSYANMDIPLTQIATMQLAGDQEMASLTFRNGDKLKGGYGLDTLQLQTIFGDVSVACEYVKMITVYSERRSTALPQEGLVAWYGFDKNRDGKVMDKCAEEACGKVVGAEWIANGKVGGAFAFDGRQNYIDLPSSGLPHGSSSRTMSVWAKPSSLTRSYHWAVSYGKSSSGNNWFIGASKTGSLRYGAWGHAGGYSSGAANVWKVGQWTHVCTTYDGTTAKAYVNGKPLSETTKAYRTIEDGANIGRQSASYPEHWHGVVDELMIYNRALSEREIRQLYDGQK